MGNMYSAYGYVDCRAYRIIEEDWCYSHVGQITLYYTFFIIVIILTSFSLSLRWCLLRLSSVMILSKQPLFFLLMMPGFLDIICAYVRDCLARASFHFSPIVQVCCHVLTNQFTPFFSFLSNHFALFCSFWTNQICLHTFCVPRYFVS